MKPYTLEVCVDSVASALEAQAGGADRLELCSNLIIGGTSPGRTLFRQVKAYTDLEVRVLVRPRFGDFCYDKYEFENCLEEVAMYRDLGADGVVIGILRPDGTLHLEEMARLIHEAQGMKVTLHRAFDMCKDPYEAMEQAINLGVNTILTSGQCGSAWEGRKTLAQLEEKSQGRIEIQAGAGINAERIAGLLPFTGIRAYHMSGKETLDSEMIFRRTGVDMGLTGFSEYERWQTSRENVRKARLVLDEATRA